MSFLHLPGTMEEGIADDQRCVVDDNQPGHHKDDEDSYNATCGWWVMLNRKRMFAIMLLINITAHIHSPPPPFIAFTDHHTSAGKAMCCT